MITNNFIKKIKQAYMGINILFSINILQMRMFLQIIIRSLNKFYFFEENFWCLSQLIYVCKKVI